MGDPAEARAREVSRKRTLGLLVLAMMALAALFFAVLFAPIWWPFKLICGPIAFLFQLAAEFHELERQ